MHYYVLQSSVWVAILNEMFHEYRLISVDGRAHVGSETAQRTTGGDQCDTEFTM